MYKNILIAIVLFSFSFAIKAQNQGGISNELLIEIEKKSNVANNEYKALKNAIANNNIKDLAYNQSNKSKIDTYFSHRVKTKGITDQKSSGRCWIFTGLNVLKPYVLDKYEIKEFEFSQNYVFFYDQLEKANLFLEGIIQTLQKPMNDREVEWLFNNCIGDGGQWSMFADLISKYGVVPKSAMPETYNSGNTRLISGLLKKKLKEYGMQIRTVAKGKKMNEQIIRNQKTEMLAEIYRMLVFSLGQPPKTFDWRFEIGKDSVSEQKTYTPKQFLNEVVEFNPEDYILLMNDPTRDYYKLYEVERDKNMYEGTNWRYINIPADDMKQPAISSIKNNKAMYFSCDVGKQLYKEDGILDVNNYNYGNLFDVQFGMDKKQRILTHASGSSHGMTLVAVDINESNKPQKWLLENSWGKSYGHRGYLIMTDKWFDEYMFRIVIHKNYVAKKIKDVLSQKPIMLPPWDPMFEYEN